MRPNFQYFVKSNLPQVLQPLKELADNFWWTWKNEAKKLFHLVDRDLFIKYNHNPKQLLSKIPQKRINSLVKDEEFIAKMNKVYHNFLEYKNSRDWYKSQHSDSGIIAYFSPEFGINESFPNYSGGLGVLSGDHLKSASDLGLPLIAIGLLYQEGYFRQRLTQHGWQTELYNYNDFFSMPLEVVTLNGKELIVNFDMPDGEVFARVWKLDVGTIQLYLLDSNISENDTIEKKQITNRLYGGDRETRIRQEIILGIGGMKALDLMGLRPSVVHINEGHAAFALLERTHQYMTTFGLDFYAALEITKSSSVFTTHTPVPAGNEEFTIDRIEKYLSTYLNKLNINLAELLKLGKSETSDPIKFSMTILGLNLSAYCNGVSKLHGEVSRKMWKDLWNNFNIEEIPIGSVTNGIHTETWLSSEFEKLFDKYFPENWRENIDDSNVWNKVNDISNSEIWNAKKIRKERLIDFSRWHLTRNKVSYLSSYQQRDIESFLNEDYLTIGFARRFATYKRASLLFKDMDRLKRILTNPTKPIQILIAGKAHPHDTAGKETIKEIIEKIKTYDLEKHVLFLEDYDMVVARLLVKGCDVWLNNPIRPLEASGTSGMKSALNGGLNLSILDGWWEEAYNSENGFSFGTMKIFEDPEEQNIVEVGELYDILEFELANLYYDKDENGIPNVWVNKMKNAIATIGGVFSTHRMVKEYATKYYISADLRFKEMINGKNNNANEFKEWKAKMIKHWNEINLFDTKIDAQENLKSGDIINLRAKVYLSEISPNDILVQAYYGDWSPEGTIANSSTFNLNLISYENNMAIFEGEMKTNDSGMFGLTFRVIPNHNLLKNYAELHLIKWL